MHAMHSLNALPIDLLSTFVIALGLSFSHCLGMCGGIVVAYTQLFSQTSLVVRFSSHFFYGFGRITSYALIGAVCGYFGEALSATQSQKGGFFIIVGFLMFAFGLALFFSPRILRILEPNIAGFGGFRAFFSRILRLKSLLGVFVLGVLNGFLPCGVVYFFALSAAVSGGAIDGAVVMLVFGAATLVPMVLFGAFNSLLNLTKFRALIHKISLIFVAAFGLYTIFKGFRILFS